MENSPSIRDQWLNPGLSLNFMDSDLIYSTADVLFMYSTTDKSKIIYTVSNSCTLSEEFNDKAKGGWIIHPINMGQQLSGKTKPKNQKLKLQCLH